MLRFVGFLGFLIVLVSFSNCCAEVVAQPADARDAATSLKIAQAAHPVNFVSQITSGRAFTSAGEEIQQPLLEIAQLASKYAGLSEPQLLALPNIASKQERNDGGFLRVHYRDEAGLVTEIDFSRREKHVNWIKITRPDESGVSVSLSYMENPARTAIHAGYVARPGGKGALEFEFDPATNQPRWAIPCVGAKGNALVQGRFLAWDPSGNQILTHDFAEGTRIDAAMQEIFASATTGQLDALGLSTKERLLNSPAFRQATFSLKHSMNILAGWPDNILDAGPDNLAAALHGDTVERVDAGKSILYRVLKESQGDESGDEATPKGDEDWHVYYDKETGELQRATRQSGLSLFFDNVEGRSRFVGGLNEVRDELEEGGGIKKYWIVGFYPGKVAPRIAVFASGDSIDKLLANGKVHLWDPAGDSLVDKDIDKPVTIATVVAEIDSMLSAEQKASINWRGAKESDYLLGEF
ncbi:MAG: hypothetical protein K1Y02_15780 [Candidatus Hydrogenedentes bacterium]|nr:hypothetical protein [Candidatus Hydrogenedentota bacterium]